ncbi:MAG TPA: carboxymuconolactone decarboxylase family protein [Gammaproteobacteria bacterium]|jgi:alkyl hydroperoxide reductase subunit D|nr:carboxymuconolactone decarboxylase family protein [Gammaproteobacteria bacterium]
MDLTELKSLIPEHAKDLKLNVASVLSAEGAPGLSWQQILALALASAIAARNPALLRQIETLVLPRLDAAQVNAARAAAAIMGMNNIYYRFVHLVGNDEYAKLPAKLRMNVIGNPGVDKTDFELYSLAVSAINGCGACVAAHEKVVRKAGVTAEGVQSAVRIAAVIHGIAVALESSALPAAQLAA